MSEVFGEKPPHKIGDRRVHMANERTFLAWIRTSIGLFTLGFVIEKFPMFAKQMAYYISKPSPGYEVIDAIDYSNQFYGYTSMFGLLLICVGTLLAAFSFVRYLRVEKQIEQDTYQSSLTLDVLITVTVLITGIFLVFYLIYSA
jgi:putative membrane protein